MPKDTTEIQKLEKFKKHSKSGKKAKSKGGRREREWVNFLKEHGILSARRTAQFNGKAGLSDVVTPKELPSFHHEVKGGQQLNIHEALTQAASDAEKEGLSPIVAHRKNNTDWVVSMKATDWMHLALAYEKLKEQGGGFSNINWSHENSTPVRD